MIPGATDSGAVPMQPLPAGQTGACLHLRACLRCCLWLHCHVCVRVVAASGAASPPPINVSGFAISAPGTIPPASDAAGQPGQPGMQSAPAQQSDPMAASSAPLLGSSPAPSSADGGMGAQPVQVMAPVTITFHGAFCVLYLADAVVLGFAC